MTEEGSGDMRTRFCSASCEKKFWKHPHWENSHTRMNFHNLDMQVMKDEQMRCKGA